MRFHCTLAASLLFSAPILLTGMRAEAEGPFKQHLHGDCPTEKSVVRLPAQEIRIETSKPRVIVHQAPSMSRTRGYFPAGPAFMPVANGPFVAHFPAGVTFHTANFGVSGTTGSTGSSALDAIHALERQHMEFTKRQAELHAEMNLVKNVQQRVLSNINAAAAPSNVTAPSDSAQLKTSIDNLSKRIGDIETLLILHDKWIKAQPK